MKLIFVDYLNRKSSLYYNPTKAFSNGYAVGKKFVKKAMKYMGIDSFFSLRQICLFV